MNIDIQRQILAYLIMNNALYYEYEKYLNECYFTDIYKLIYLQIKHLIDISEKADLISISKLVPDSYILLTEILTDKNPAFDIEQSVNFLLEAHLKSELNNLAIDILNKSKGDYDVIELISKLQDKLSKIQIVDTKDIKSIYEATIELINHLKEQRKTNSTSGIKTGVLYFDTMTGGLQAPDLIILAGEGGQGKTALALNICKNIAEIKHKCAFISYEMGLKQLSARLIAIETGISVSKIITGNFNDLDFETIKNSTNYFNEKGIFIVDCPPKNINQLQNVIRSLRYKYGCEAFFIDYLQLVEKTGVSREQEVGGVARALKNLAMELSVPIVALSQLSRSQDHIPSLRRLRDSGQIEEAADIVMFTFRPEQYINESEQYNVFPGTEISSIDMAQVIVAKGRNYGVGSWYMRFVKHTTEFINMQPHELE